MTPPEGRKRGRPAAGSSPDTREHIISVAREHLAAKGFAGSSMRGIAREAGVDPSLISHYFGDKAGLLVATMELPINPIEKIRAVFASPLDDMGGQLIRTFLGAWDPHRDVFSALLRTTLGSGDPSAAPVVQVIRGVIVTELQELIDGEGTELRATLVAAEIIGLATIRYVARLEPVASAPIDQVVRWYGASVQELMTPSER